MLAFGVLLVILSCLRLMRLVAELPWVDWLISAIGAFFVIASILRLIKER